jgi:putative thioredoxin
MIDTTLSSFEQDVIDASMEAPVVVDFWAAGCAPSKMLTPVLERLEREYGGRFTLVNINADLNPELVASFNLKSIPYTVAFVNGNAVAQFVGAQPEVFLRAFLDRIIPDPSLIEHRAAREALVKGMTDVAEVYLGNAIALDPSNDGARLDMASLLLDRGETAAARRHFDALSDRAATQQSNRDSVLARLEAAEAAMGLPPAAELEQRLWLDENDHQARLALAELQTARRDFEPALAHLLEIVRRDRGFRDGIARLKMLSVFVLAAHDEALVTGYRRKLSSLLF